MHRNNRNFKVLCAALQLSKSDVFEIMGRTVSKSQIDGWRRGEEARKRASGNSEADTVTRFKAMSNEDFDRFCTGLLDWFRPKEEDCSS